MNLAAPHRVAAEFAGSDEDGEDAVTAAGLQVHRGFADVAVGVTDEEVVERLLFAARRVRRQVAEVYVAVTVFPQGLRCTRGNSFFTSWLPSRSSASRSYLCKV